MSTNTIRRILKRYSMLAKGVEIDTNEFLLTPEAKSF